MKVSIKDGDKPESAEERAQPEPNELMNEAVNDPDDKGEDVAEETAESPADKKPEKKKRFFGGKGHGEKLKKVIENLKEEVAQKEEERKAANEKALRAVADADNFKKRLAREGDEAKRYAASSIVEALLPVIDNLEKAVASTENNDDTVNVDTLRQGVELVKKQLMETLQSRGLEKLEVVGKPFDPETSEAIQMVETDEMEDGFVIEDYIAGYKFKDRVIRHAKALVAKTPSEKKDHQD